MLASLLFERTYLGDHTNHRRQASQKKSFTIISYFYKKESCVCVGVCERERERVREMQKKGGRWEDRQPGIDMIKHFAATSACKVLKELKAVVVAEFIEQLLLESILYWKWNGPIKNENKCNYPKLILVNLSGGENCRKKV